MIRHIRPVYRMPTRLCNIVWSSSDAHPYYVILFCYYYYNTITKCNMETHPFGGGAAVCQSAATTAIVWCSRTYFIITWSSYNVVSYSAGPHWPWCKRSNFSGRWLLRGGKSVNLSLKKRHYNNIVYINYK